MIDTERGNREVADQAAGYGSYIIDQWKEYLRETNKVELSPKRQEDEDLRNGKPIVQSR